MEGQGIRSRKGKITDTTPASCALARVNGMGNNSDRETTFSVRKNNWKRAFNAKRNSVMLLFFLNHCPAYHTPRYIKV